MGNGKDKKPLENPSVPVVDLSFGKQENPLDRMVGQYQPVLATAPTIDYGQSKYDDSPASLETITSGEYKYLRGEKQNGFAQLGLGVGRAVSKAVTEAAKTPGYLWALGESWGDKTLAESLDNTWLNTLEGLDAKVKETLPVYQSYKSGKGGLVDALTSTSFWASDGADGVGYLLGMMAPGAALKGLGYAGMLSRLGASAKVASNVELGTQTLLNSSLEAMGEAKGVVDQLKAQGVEPEKIADAAYDTFMSNMALLVVPNAIMNKNLLGRFTKDKSLLDNFTDATGKLVSNPILKKNAIKDYAKSIGSAAFAEGFIEEGGQTAIENYEKNKALGKTDKNFLEGVAESYVDALTTTEGQKAILLGSVLGSLGSVAGTYREGKELKRLAPKLSDLIDNNFQGFSVKNDIYKRDENGSIVINPETNTPELDISKAQKAVLNFIGENKQAQEKDLAALANDKVLHDYISNEQFTRYAIPFIEMGEAGLEILNQHIDNASKTVNMMNEQSIAGAKGLDFEESSYKNNLKSKAKELAKIYDSTIETVKGLDFLTSIDPKVDPQILNEYINDVAHAIFQENSKQVFLKESIRDLSTELLQLNSSISGDLPQNRIIAKKLQREIEGLNNLLKQSEQYYETLFDPKQHKEALAKKVERNEEFKRAEEEAVKATEPVPVTKDDVEVAEAGNEALSQLVQAMDSNTLEEFEPLFNSIQKSKHLLSPEDLEALEMKKNQLHAIKGMQEGASEEVPKEIVTTDVSKDQDIVSQTLSKNTANTETEVSQLNEDKDVMNLDIERGIKNRNNVVMMHLFDHYFDKNDNFRWKRNEEGLPNYDNNSRVNLTAVNKARVGDKVELKLVTLGATQTAQYILQKVNSLEKGKQYVQESDFDDKHIGIYFDNELIGFVQQPHLISPKARSVDESIELRNELIKYRKAVVEKLDKGELVTETISEKGNGNLYTKLTDNGSIDPTNSVFETPRVEDHIDNTLIFVYSNGEDLVLPISDINEKAYEDLKELVSKYKKYGKSGKVYQMVRNLVGTWSPIPVYANRMDTNSIKSIINIINAQDNTSDSKRIVASLNDYIYASMSKGGADLIIKNLDDTLIFTINGNEYTLDEIKDKGPRYNDFVSDLKTKRQNININKINNSFYQADLKKRNTLSTNVLTFQGEYFVQPYLEYTTSLVEPKEEKPIALNEDKPVDNKPLILKSDKLESLKKRFEGKDTKKMLGDDDALSSKHISGKQLDRPQFKKWLSEKLPQLTLSDIDTLKSIKDTSVDAYGLFRNSTVYLFEGATMGTAYHEAFHGVFRNLLTNQEKFDVIEEAITKYEAPTAEDLYNLQEGLNYIYTKEQLTYLHYEEKLADDFAKYSVNFSEQSLGTKILNFFKKILNFFKITKKDVNNKVEDLFDRIQGGKYSSVQPSPEGTKIFDRTLDSEYAYNRNLDKVGFKPTDKLKITQSIGNQFLKIYQDNLLANKDERPISIWKQIQDRYVTASEENDGKNQAVSDKAGLIAIEFDEFVKEARKYLSFRGVKINEDYIDFGSDLIEDYLGDEEIESLRSQTTKGLGDWTSISGLSSASTRIKLFLSSIPVIDESGKEVKDAYGIQEYYDFNKLYYYIERNLTDLYTFEDQLEELKRLSIGRLEIQQVIKMLENKTSNMNDEQFVQTQNDFKTNFSKQQMAFTLVKFDTDSNTGEVTFSVIDANRQSLNREIAETWSKNLEDSTRTKTISKFTLEGDVERFGTEAAKLIQKQWEDLVSKKSPIPYDVANNILTQAGIDFTPEVLQTLLDDNSNEFKSNVSRLLRYYADDMSSNTFSANEKIGREALYKLVKYEVSAAFDSYTSSFNTADNKAVYTIQLPSFASRLLAKLRSSNVNVFRNTINELEKDPFYKHSNLLNELKSDITFRKNGFKLSYIDGLKDQRGDSKGSKFTSMTPKDFLSMQVALFQNKAVNENRTATDTLHKYVYITPSDKTMGMIFDAKSYGVNLVNNNINLNSEIVGKFYNIFLQETNRIKHALDIKDDILANRDNSKYSLDELLMYYHVSKSNWEDFSELASKQSSGESLTDKEWLKISKMFTGQAYQYNYFSQPFNSVVKRLVGDTILSTPIEDLENALLPLRDKVLIEIRNYLQYEYTKTREEFVTKGVISKNDKTGLYENISLSLTSKDPLSTNNEINNLIVSYSLNSFLHNIELSNILNGDVALYKPNDLQKRTYQSQSMITNNNFENKIIRTMVVKDYETGSKEYDNIVKIFTELGLNEDSIKNIVGKYRKGINVTDAQVYISPEFYKRIHISRGTWSPEMQEAFDIAEGKKVGSIPDAYHRLLAGIKPFYFGNRFDEHLGIQKYEQVKCAMLPLFKSYTDLNPLLASKRQEMENNGIDMLAHESSFKATIGNRNDITGDPSLVLDLNADNFGIQVDNPDHMVDGNDSMRQLKMLILGSIDATRTYKGIKGQEIIDSIMSMEATNIKESFNQLQQKMDFKNNTDFANFVKDMITKRGATINVEEALTIIDGDFEYALDNGNLSTQIENMISSIYTNNVIKQEFAIGGSAVQASSIGFKWKNLEEQQENLTEEAILLQQELAWIKPNLETGEIGYAECAMPAWSEKFFDKDGKVKDINNIPEVLKQLVTYRIPTEGLHSMLPIKVVKFLPETMGNFMLLPYEVTTQLGADFDFDKTYFIGREFYTTSGNNLVPYVYTTGTSEADVQSRWENYLRYIKVNKINQDYATIEQFSELSIPEQNTRAARNNNILDNYLHLLTSIENLELLITPSGFDTLADFKEKYFKQESKTYGEDSFFSSRIQRDYKERNHVGIALKGQSALHVSGHSYSTLMNLNTDSKTESGNTDRTRAINFNNNVATNFSGLYTQNGKLIADELSSIMAAILDDIKNPLLKYLGINNNTIDVLATIIRSGYNMDTALRFISQPSIKEELSDLLTKNKNKIKESSQGYFNIDTVITSYNNKLEKALGELSPDVDSSEISDSANYHNINDSEMDFYLTKWNEIENKTSEDWANYYAFQLRVLKNFQNIARIADELVNINKFFAINKEVGPNIENIISKIDIYDQIMLSDVVKGFDINKIPSLKETYDVHKNALKWFERYFPYSTDVYMDIKNRVISSQTNKKLNQISVEDRVLMNGFIRDYFDHSSGIFQTKYDYLFKQLPMLLKDIKDISKRETKLGNVTYNQIRQNTFINEIKTVLDKNNNVWNITLKGNRLDLQVKNNVILGFEALYANSSTKQLAIDLIEHTFVSSGFFTGLNSYASLINPAILKDLGYNDFRKTITNNLRNNLVSLPEEDMNRLIDQLIRNFPKLTGVNPITKVYDDTMFGINGTELPDSITTTEAAVKEAKRTSDFLFGTKDDPQTPMYIRVYDKSRKKAIIFKRDLTNIFKYYKVDNLGRKGYFIEINPFDDIEVSFLKDNRANSKLVRSEEDVTTEGQEETFNDEVTEHMDSDALLGKDKQQESEDKPINNKDIEGLPDIDKC